MKKILLFTSILVLALFVKEAKAQTIDSVSISNPLLCFGDKSDITVHVTQAPTPIAVRYILKSTSNGIFYFQIGQAPLPPGLTFGTAQPFPNLFAGLYRLELIDVSGNTLSSLNFSITQPLELLVSTTPLLLLECNSDCDASEKLAILGGTLPYSITINGITSVLGISSIDTTYSNLCADTYDATIIDVNGCITSPEVTSFTITEPPELIPNGSNLLYNGQDISCFGEDDGEITCDVSGGTPTYTYSIDGVTFNPIPNNVFPGLFAGTYTIYYLDENGCDTSETITLTDPPNLSGSITINQDVSCNGVADGILAFTINNINIGTPGYSYSIDNGVTFQNSNTFSGLAGGQTHTILVEDTNGCQSLASIFLSEPTEIVFTAASQDFNGFGVSCHLATDGQIIIQSPTGGTPNYDYSIDGGNNYSSSMIYNVLGEGSYLVTVRDDNNCTNDTNIIIAKPLPFTINASATSSYNGSEVSCYGLCDGEVTVTQLNGVGAINYTMTSYSTQISPSWVGVCGVLSFGVYTIGAVDANGCTANTSIDLIEPNPWAYTVDSTEDACSLGNGQVAITVTQGGIGSLTYLWNDSSAQINNTATNLLTGLYEVIVTDTNGCTFTDDVFVGESNLALNFDSVSPCSGGSDGMATVTPNGTPPYQISWFNGDTTNTISNLTAGFYSVTVTDANLCSITDSVEIVSVSNIVLTLDSSNSMLSVLCNGFQSDTISVIASGGTGIGTYQYNIPAVFPIPQYNNIFSGLYAGVYVVYATDANGCSDSVSVTITEPSVIYFTATSSDVNCYAGVSGSVWLDSVSGGTSPYSYSWNTGQNTDTLSNLIAGTYNVSVTDVNNCSSNPQQVSVIVNEPLPLTSSINIINHSSCSGTQAAANGAAEVLASGGTSEYNYSWSNGVNGTNITLLFPDTYTVDITDANGCMITDTAIINPGTNPILNVTVQDVSCFGANDGMMITSADSGATPYQFSSDGGSTFVPFGINFGPSGQASYFITVVDTLGCTGSDSVYVSEPDLLIVSSNFVKNVSCYDSANGELEAIVLGGTPGYSYSWIDVANNIVATTQTATNLIPGNYSVSVTDTNGCFAVSSSSLAITQPDSLYISSLISSEVLCNGDSTGTATVAANGGTPNYFYNWSSGSNSNVASALKAGTYLVAISDSKGCSRSSSIVVAEPTALSSSFVKDSITCVGESDGWATVLVIGGVAPYNYLWDNGDTLFTANSLNAGFHTVLITDFNGCMLIDSVNILEPTFSITIDSLIVSEITCHGNFDASITVLATGGKLPYMYSNTNGINLQSTIGFNSLGSDTYAMYVKDALGCIDRDTIEIISPDSLYIDTTVFSNVQCYGSNNASIQSISAFGGTSPYEYSVNFGAHHANMAYFNGYGTGTYNVQVFDVNNCVAQDIIIITEPDELDVTIITSEWNSYQIKCYGDNSGFADIAVNGGLPPYLKTVLDSNGVPVFSSYNSSVTGLTAGAYTFEISDANGCTYTENIIYNEPSPITHNFIATHVSCNGWSNGSLTDVVSGGVGTSTTYNYTWSPVGSNTYSINSIPIGVYTMTVVDNNNCVSVDSCIINDNNALNVTVSGTDVSCYDYCDGIILTNANGGMPNINSSGVPVYTYQWNDILSQTTASAIGLCVDNTTNSTTYTCIVTDGNGCKDTLSYILPQPESLNVTASIIDKISCNLDDNGKLTANVTGGNGGVNYLWNNWTNFMVSPINNNLSVGSYVLVAKDSKGCMDTTEIYLAQPSSLSLTLSETDVSCFGFDDGEITASAMGGTVIGIQEYNYNWTGGLNEQVTVSTATGLTPNIYSVTVTDANGCVITSESIYITEPGNPLSIRVDSIDETCELNNGVASAFVDGGTLPFTYLWNNGKTTVQIDDLAPNIYTVVVTDRNGCTISSQTFVNGVQNILLPGNLSSIDTVICLGRSVSLPIEVKPELNYMWLYNNDTIYKSNSVNYTDIIVTPTAPFNVYTLYITDPTCLNPYTISATINVEAIDPLPSTSPIPENGPYATIVKGNSIEIFSNNLDCDIYEWSWLDKISATRIITDSPEKSGWYHIAVDSLGCLGFDSIYIVVGVKPYDAITPNGDGFNDVWNVLDIESYPEAVVQIFNRWGSLVHETGGLNYVAWDGTNEGKELPVGTYYYIIDLKTDDEPQSGPITIIR